MNRAEFNADIEALRAELRKKGHDLLLAARYGKGLLEENSQYEKDLESARQEVTTLTKALKSQRHESQRAVSECRHVAEMHVAELEQQLDNLRSTMEKERCSSNAVKEEYQRLIDQFKAENAQLKDQFDEVTEDRELLDNQLQHLTAKLNECEAQKLKLTQDLSDIEEQTNLLKDTNRTLDESVGTLVHTCDQLSDELENSREEIEDLEHRYQEEKDELVSTMKELEDTQDQLKQAQIQLDQQSVMVLTPNESINSRMSLFDELYSSRDSSLDNALSDNGCLQEEMLSVYSDSDVPDSFCGDLSPVLLRRVADVAPALTTSSPLSHHGWTKDTNCQRCDELEKQLNESRAESESVAKQLIIAVQQKFKLQEQIEAWQSDMAQMVEKQVHLKLSHQQKKRRGSSKKPKNCTCSRDSSTCRVHQDSDPGITYHLAKSPWIF